MGEFFRISWIYTSDTLVKGWGWKCPCMEYPRACRHSSCLESGYECEVSTFRLTKDHSRIVYIIDCVKTLIKATGIPAFLITQRWNPSSIKWQYLEIDVCSPMLLRWLLPFQQKVDPFMAGVSNSSKYQAGVLLQLKSLQRLVHHMNF